MTDPTQGLPAERTVPIGAPAAPSPDPAPAGPPSEVRAPGEAPRAASRGGGPARAPRRSMVPVVAAAAVAGLVGGLGGGVLAQQLSTEPAAAPVVHEARVAGVGASVAPPPGADGSIAGLARLALPSVALISVGADGGAGQGSGFVLRQDGYLLTNAHVIGAAGDSVPITVELPGQEPLPAQVIGADATYDIAVLKVDVEGLDPLPFAGPDTVEVGQTVVAVGAPLGLDSTVTSGIISAQDRPVVAGEDPRNLSYINAIQTDAAINPGNSGGPLLDLEGHVVGVNSAIAQLPTGAFGGPAGSIGLGFAIPAEQAERTAVQLIESGSSRHPVMGVHIDMEYTGEGARVMPRPRDGVAPVIDGGPAEEAGVRPGDVIVAVDDTRIRDSQHLLVVLRSYAVGDTVQMLLRDDAGQERSVRITLAGSDG